MSKKWVLHERGSLYETEYLARELINRENHQKQMNEMKWTLLYRLISGYRGSQHIEDSRQMSCLSGGAEPKPNAKINCLFSHCHIFGHFLVSQSSFKLHYSLPFNFIPCSVSRSIYLFSQSVCLSYCMSLSSLSLSLSLTF